MAFFENCPDLQVAIYFQMTWSMMFNAFLITFFFARIARVESRAAQLLFSDKAIITRDAGGKLIFEIRVYDADASHPIVECHARLYVVHSIARCDCVQLRVIRPNDEFNSALLASIPSKITHHIDVYSALMPPKFRNPKNMVDSHGLHLREVDSYTGNREGYICQACGETLGTHRQLWMHIRCNQIMEKYSQVPAVKGTHLALGNENDAEKRKEPSFEDIRHYWETNQMEVLAIVEGTDPLTSGTFQGLQSYQIDNIIFGGTFAECFTDDNAVDFDLFHTVVTDEKVKGNPMIDIKITEKASKDDVEVMSNIGGGIIETVSVVEKDISEEKSEGCAHPLIDVKDIQQEASKDDVEVLPKVGKGIIENVSAFAEDISEEKSKECAHPVIDAKNIQQEASRDVEVLPKVGKGIIENVSAVGEDISEEKSEGCAHPLIDVKDIQQEASKDDVEVLPKVGKGIIENVSAVGEEKSNGISEKHAHPVIDIKSTEEKASKDVVEIMTQVQKHCIRNVSVDGERKSKEKSEEGSHHSKDGEVHDAKTPEK